MPNPDSDPLPFVFFNEIGIIEQLARNAFERVMPGDMKVSHFVVLNHFARLGGERSPAELARAFQLTKGAMTNTLQRLEARGLVAIQPDPRDGRGKRVTITAKGRRVRDQAVAALEPMFDQLLQTFSEAEFAAVLPFLQRLRAHLDEARSHRHDSAGVNKLD